ncbi:MAG: sulfatase-like hydrolase/transferase [Kiritimatiellaeota bacterium]|nr:sulfatase-like hydrolase/transferase [Kiritimatiellota bacterium]
MKVVYIMADTFRRDHLGTYGNRWIKTPNLDRFAAGAAVFEDACIGSFPTVPNRRDTLLGHSETGLPFNRWKAFERDEVTLPERLAEKNIPSMLITDTQNNVTKGINIYKGFTAWHVNRGQEGDRCWLDANVPLEFPVPPHLIRYPADWWHQVLVNRAHRRVETDWFAPGTYRTAMHWLERNYKRDDFFLWVDTFDPHEPWDPPQHYIDLYDPDYKGRVFEAPTYGVRKKMGITDAELKQIRARYAGEVTMVDTWAGQLFATLERLGIMDETLVVFTSDHGTLFDGPGDNGLLCKGNIIGDDGMYLSAGRPMTPPLHYYPIYMNVARIPLLVKPPGLTRGQRIRGVVQPWDMTATVLDAFGMAKPPEFIGESLLPVIQGKGKPRRAAAVCGTNLLAQAVAGRWVYTVWQKQHGPSLLDLRTDPEAARNVYSEHPSVAKRLHREIVEFMRRQEVPEELIERYRTT